MHFGEFSEIYVQNIYPKDYPEQIKKSYKLIRKHRYPNRKCGEGPESTFHKRGHPSGERMCNLRVTRKCEFPLPSHTTTIVDPGVCFPDSPSGLNHPSRECR